MTEASATVAVRNGMLPRDEGMSRQVQRRLYRVACRIADVEPSFQRPQDKRKRRLARKQAERSKFDLPSRSARKKM